jgi:hypothetical protein
MWQQISVRRGRDSLVAQKYRKLLSMTLLAQHDMDVEQNTLIQDNNTEISV